MPYPYRISCGHKFHYPCIQSAADAGHVACPNCRNPVAMLVLHSKDGVPCADVPWDCINCGPMPAEVNIITCEGSLCLNKRTGQYDREAKGVCFKCYVPVGENVENLPDFKCQGCVTYEARKRPRARR